MAVMDDDTRMRVERQFRRVVERLGERDLTVDEWRRRAPSPLPGSQLAGDDIKTTYDPLSFQVQFYLSAAQDNLLTVREILDVVGHIPPMALYSMARAAIEAAAYGVWLLSGGTRVKRVKRSLRLSYDAQRTVVEISHAAGTSFDVDAVYEELEQNKRALKGLDDRADLSAMPTISDILRDVDRGLRIEPASALEAWRICSGMTHANRWVAAAVSETVDLPDPNTEWELTGSAAMLATVLTTAVELRDHLRQQFLEAGGHRPTQ